MISVIVPVYNTEKYLDRCIQSILAQTYTDFELLLIDDGSTDLSGEICDKYAEQDSRVKVFHKENGGVSSARNLGLDKANGDWVTFVDADDWVPTLYLNNLSDNTNSADFVVSIVGENDNISYQGSIIKKLEANLIGDYIEAATNFLTWSSPWAKIYKRTILEEKNIRFDERLFSGEDLVFVLEYMCIVRSILVKESCGYCYTETRGLSKREMNYNEINLVVEKIIYNISCLEYKYHIDLTKWKVNSIWNYITKYKVPNNLSSLYNDIKQLSRKQYMQQIVLDRIVVPKGVYRKIFDFLYKNRLYLLLSYLVFMTKRFYR